MHVLVATTELQGRRGSDFCHTVEGELVYLGSECDIETIDGGCGCRRSMAGMDSRKGTTTIKVIDPADMTRELLRQLVRAALERGGWLRPEDPSNEDWVSGMTDYLAEVAESFPAGAVLERRGGVFRERT
jgi:hypothetical protein